MPDLLAEAGYEYVLDWCVDDQPIWMNTRSGKPILSVLYPQELNDIPAIATHKDSHRQLAEAITDTFEEVPLQAEKSSLVTLIAIHPYIVRQPHRRVHLCRISSSSLTKDSKSGLQQPW